MRAELERLVEELTERLRALRLGFAQSDGYVADGLMIARDELSRILTRSDWIPVSERLPDDGVLCWVMVCGIRGMYRWHDSLVKHGAEAWQPIEEPAPYRAEGGGGVIVLVSETTRGLDGWFTTATLEDGTKHVFVAPHHIAEDFWDGRIAALAWIDREWPGAEKRSDLSACRAEGGE